MPTVTFMEEFFQAILNRQELWPFPPINRTQINRLNSHLFDLTLGELKCLLRKTQKSPVQKLIVVPYIDVIS